MTAVKIPKAVVPELGAGTLKLRVSERSAAAVPNAENSAVSNTNSLGTSTLIQALDDKAVMAGCTSA